MSDEAKWIRLKEPLPKISCGLHGASADDIAGGDKKRGGGETYPCFAVEAVLHICLMRDSVVVVRLGLVVLVVLVAGLHASSLLNEEAEPVLLAADRRPVVALAPRTLVVVLRLETRTQCHLHSLMSTFKLCYDLVYFELLLGCFLSALRFVLRSACLLFLSVLA